MIFIPVETFRAVSSRDNWRHTLFDQSSLVFLDVDALAGQAADRLVLNLPKVFGNLRDQA